MYIHVAPYNRVPFVCLVSTNASPTLIVKLGAFRTLQHDIGEHAYDEFVATYRKHESVQVLMVSILLTTVTAIKDLMYM